MRCDLAEVRLLAREAVARGDLHEARPRAAPRPDRHAAVRHGDLEQQRLERYFLTLCRVYKTQCDTTLRRRAEGKVNSQNDNSRTVNREQPKR